VIPAINTALQFWAQQRRRTVQYVHKGEPIRTEMKSAIKYKVEDPLDKSTVLDDDLLQKLKVADKLLVCGQTLSHTVRHTTRRKY
jgi:nicotinamidase/pyrazinamidase